MDCGRLARNVHVGHRIACVTKLADVQDLASAFYLRASANLVPIIRRVGSTPITSIQTKNGVITAKVKKID